MPGQLLGNVVGTDTAVDKVEIMPSDVNDIVVS
jgi:hypothetical protein